MFAGHPSSLPERQREDEAASPAEFALYPDPAAVELDQATVKQIGDRIAEQTGQRVDLSATVEPDILGGIVVRVGNQVLDASVRNRLEQLRKQVARA